MSLILGILALAGISRIASDAICHVFGLGHNHRPRLLEATTPVQIPEFAGGGVVHVPTRDGVEVRFVGGPMDGEVRHVPPGAREWIVSGYPYDVYTRINTYTFQFVTLQVHRMRELNRGYTVDSSGRIERR